MEELGKEKIDWPRKFAAFANGIPSHDCVATVISRLRPKAFQSCFVDWTRAVAEATDGEVVTVDGKTARGSRDRRRGKQALRMVSARGCRNRPVPGQEATEEKSNEMTAIPKLLELLVLKGCIVTIDAMGCRTQIIDQGGDYVLGLKGNQSTLHAEVESFFGSLKSERVHWRSYQTREEARADIVEYLTMFQNSQRLHSYPGYRSPEELERNGALADAAYRRVRFRLTTSPR